MIEQLNEGGGVMWSLKSKECKSCKGKQVLQSFLVIFKENESIENILYC